MKTCRGCGVELVRGEREAPSRWDRRVTCGNRECVKQSIARSLTREDRYRVEDRGFDSPCWVWTLHIGDNGYGELRSAGRGYRAHRWYYEQEHGPIPEGMHLDHLCRVRACVNPAHLEVVTPHENWRRGVNTKLTAGEVAEIKASPLGYRRLAAQYGVSRGAIKAIYDGRSWRDVEAAA